MCVQIPPGILQRLLSHSCFFLYSNAQIQLSSPVFSDFFLCVSFERGPDFFVNGLAESETSGLEQVDNQA